MEELRLMSTFMAILVCSQDRLDALQNQMHWGIRLQIFHYKIQTSVDQNTNIVKQYLKKKETQQSLTFAKLLQIYTCCKEDKQLKIVG